MGAVVSIFGARYAAISNSDNGYFSFSINVRLSSYLLYFLDDKHCSLIEGLTLFWLVPELNPFEFAYLTLCLLNAVVIINQDSLKRYEIMRATIGARKNNCCFILFTMIYRANTHLLHIF